MADPEERPTAIASSFAATLELVREGRVEIRQQGAFTPIYMRTGDRPLTDEDIAAMEAGLD
jgi:segregation and condensation protein A